MRKGLNVIRALKGAFDYDEIFDRSEVILCGWQDVKIQSLTSLHSVRERRPERLREVNKQGR